jgi:AraC-like DNA-binding protein
MNADRPKLKQDRGGERLVYWRVPALQGLQLLRGHRSHAHLPRHSHTTFQIAFIESGCQQLRIKGNTHRVGRGQIVVLHPGEAHTEGPNDNSGWCARAFYPSLEMILNAVASTGTKCGGTPFFQDPVLNDGELIETLRSLHQLLEAPGGDDLQRDTLAALAAARLVARHARPGTINEAPDPGRIALERVRCCLEERCTENLSLRELAAIANLNPFHLLRSFTRAYGLPPYAYLMQSRVARARALLDRGVAIIEASQEVGFFDQSHFSRNFKRLLGVTPGAYARDARSYKI